MKITYLTSDPDIIKGVEEIIAAWNDPTTSELIVQTSGSTGKPKKISLDKGHMEASAKATCQFLQLEAGQIAVLSLSTKTIGGVMMIIRALLMDLQLIVTDVSSFPLEKLNQPIDFIALVPLQVASILTINPKKFSLLNNIIVGGGTISPRLEKQLMIKEMNIFQTFGMTETISHFAMRSIAPEHSNKFNCLPGATVSTKDDKLIVDFPEIGVSHLETNDLVELSTDKRFKWIGRADFVINSGGIKIHPSEIEEKLDDLITVPFFSFGIPDERLGYKHILCLESSKEIRFSKQQLIEKLNDKIIPREIHYFDRFERTESGKINRPKTINTGARVIRQVL